MSRQSFFRGRMADGPYLYVTGCLIIEVHDSLKNGLPDFLYHINQSSMSLIHMGHTVVLIFLGIPQ